MEMMKLLLGGSPCTHWSIAQTKNRETKPEGLGWKLFKNYLIAIEKFKPDFFLYENNKSMAEAIRDQITAELGVEPIMINSATLSAQSRKRLYWTNIPGVKQPENRGIILRDVLENGVPMQEKAYTLKAQYHKNGIANFVTNGGFGATAVAEPVNITEEGKAHCLRASVHNVSILKNLKLGIGDRITVYKANMIIPQIAENLTGSGTAEIPERCPVCHGRTKISQINDVQSLYCTNEECEAKKIKSFTLFVSRDAMNIEGLSEATLEKFIGRGYIHEFADIFHLDRFREEIVEMEGFGEKSYQNLINSVEAARKTTLPRLIFSLGIANIGLANAKMICRHYHDDMEEMLAASVEDLSGIDGVGEVIATGFYEYFRKEENKRKWENLLKEVEIEKEEIDESSQTLSGMAFVVTGSLNHYASRKELKEEIEKKGGKVTGSVTSKTVCLINNDNTSSSSKNKKARELQIPVLTEEEFIEQYLGGQSDAD